MRRIPFSQRWEKRIVARERSAFAKQNTKTRLSATTKQGERSSVEGLLQILPSPIFHALINSCKKSPLKNSTLALNGNAHNCNEKLNVFVDSCSPLASLVSLLAWRGKTNLPLTIKPHFRGVLA